MTALRMSQLDTGSQITIRNALRRQKPGRAKCNIVSVIIVDTVETGRVARLELQAPDLSHPVEVVRL